MERLIEAWETQALNSRRPSYRSSAVIRPLYRAVMAEQIAIYVSERGSGPVPLAQVDATSKPA